MYKTNIKDIELYYGDKENKKIEDIIHIITINYDLVLMLLEGRSKISLVEIDDESVAYISDFDVFFNDALTDIFNTIKSRFSHFDKLSKLYFDYLTRNLGDDVKSMFNKSLHESDEIFNLELACLYFIKNENVDEFIKYMKSKSDFDKVINWLKEEAQEDTYKYLLSNIIETEDKEILKNLGNIMHIVLNINDNYVLYDSDSYPSLNKDECFSLFLEFLNYINAPLDWINWFNDLKLNEGIVFSDDKNAKYDNTCFMKIGDKHILSIDDDGTIKTFISLVHEFIHSIVSVNKTKPVRDSVKEFPSIFFEILAGDFLKYKGYDNNMVEDILLFRNKNNMIYFLINFDLLCDIYSYYQFGDISSRDRDYDRLFNYIFKKLAIGSSILGGCPYVLDSYLAQVASSKSSSDSTVINKMIDITNNLYNVGIDDILKELDIEDVFNELRDKNNEFIKIRK